MWKIWAARDGFKARGVEAAPTHLGDRIELLFAAARKASWPRSGCAHARLPKDVVSASVTVTKSSREKPSISSGGVQAELSLTEPGFSKC